MSFIGIITDKKTENILKSRLDRALDNKNTAIIINSKNIDNVKNIRFSIVVINSINQSIDKEKLKGIIKNAKIVCINSDSNFNIDLDNSTIITYGFLSKSTVTISSAEDKTDIIIYIQRWIKNINNKEIEPQEIKIYSEKDNGSIYIEIVVKLVEILT